MDDEGSIVSSLVKGKKREMWASDLNDVEQNPLGLHWLVFLLTHESLDRGDLLILTLVFTENVISRFTVDDKNNIKEILNKILR